MGAFTLLEMMVILGGVDSTIHMINHETAIERWREVFFNVWDAEWNEVQGFDARFPYSTFAYRVEHRSLVNNLFDHLWELAEDWRDNKSDDMPARDPQPFMLKDRLPHFSSLLVTAPNGEEVFVTGRFLWTFFDMLTQKIVFVLSEENREKLMGFDLYELEEVWVAIDVMAYLCEKYRTAPSLRAETIHRWLNITIGIWMKSDRAHKIDDVQMLAEKDSLYSNSLAVFVRLMTIAQRNPRAWL
jgi:hypothetical protein